MLRLPVRPPDQIFKQADRAMPTRELSELSGYTPTPTPTTVYGGRADVPRLDATGFFRVEKVRERWWLIDPEGAPFLQVAMNA